jgi:hypothetical protein
MSIHPAKQALLVEINQSRAAMVRDLRALKEEINVVAKLRTSVRAHTPFWLGGATLAGFFFTRLFGRQKKAPLFLSKESHPTSPKHLKSLSWGGATLLTLFRLLLSLVKPAIAAYTTRKIYKMAQLIK